MFSSKEEKCNMSDKGAVVSRHVVFTDDSEVVEFEHYVWCSIFNTGRCLNCFNYA